MGILSQKEIQKQRLKEAKRAGRERRKSIPTRKEREKGNSQHTWALPAGICDWLFFHF